MCVIPFLHQISKHVQVFKYFKNDFFVIASGRVCLLLLFFLLVCHIQSHKATWKSGNTRKQLIIYLITPHPKDISVNYKMNYTHRFFQSWWQKWLRSICTILNRQMAKIRHRHWSWWRCNSCCFIYPFLQSLSLNRDGLEKHFWTSKSVTASHPKRGEPGPGCHVSIAAAQSTKPINTHENCSVILQGSECWLYHKAFSAGYATVSVYTPYDPLQQTTPSARRLAISRQLLYSHLIPDTGSIPIHTDQVSDKNQVLKRTWGVSKLEGGRCSVVW